MLTILRIAICSLFLLLSQLARAADGDPQSGSFEEEEFYTRFTAEKNKSNYAGWEGIVFYCSPSTNQKEATKKICERVVTSVKFLAAAANVKLIVSKSSYDFGFKTSTSPL